MFEYLETHEGAVVAGLEQFETVYAKDQPQYKPLRTLPGESGLSALSRWTPTPEQRKAIAEGADLVLEVFHFKAPLAPVRLAVSDGLDMRGHFPAWFCSQTSGPYFSRIPPVVEASGDGADQSAT